MTTALYIGRFQPFHKGHLEYIRLILRDCDNLKIVIGSSQEKFTGKNPFSATERKKIILDCLENENIMMDRIKFYTKRDTPDDDIKWLSSLKHVVGKFDKVYAGENLHVKKIFDEAGYKTNSIARIGDISGTEIREKIIRGAEWKQYVPESVYSTLKYIKGEKRIRKK
jgi:nicotinamide-nucleotide adenylyltransferase